MSNSFDVYGLGNALVDIVVEVEDQFLASHNIEKGLMTLVEEDQQNKTIQELAVEERNMKCGGSAANTVIAVSQFGGKSNYAFKVADDREGHFYIKDIVANGVGASLKEADLPQGTTGKCLVMTTPDAERTMNTFLGITTAFDTHNVDMDLLTQSKYIYLEGYLLPSPTGVEAMNTAIDAAKANDTKVALSFSDPSMVKYFGEPMQQIVDKGIDLLFCNEEEAMIFTGKDSLEEAKAILKTKTQQLVITLGANGAYLFDGENEFSVAGVETNAIDTNGAGDMFAGAFMYGITNGLSFQKSGDLAAKAASEVVSTVGPRLTKEKAQEVLQGLA